MAGKTHFPPTGGNLWATNLSFYEQMCQYAGVTGNVWWVNSATGTDSAGFGYSPEAPLKTIAYAVGTAAVADNNDLVLVMPAHTETITGAAGVNMSVAGVTVLGLGMGRQRGTVNYTTAAAASFDITAARCCVDNLTFVGTGVASVTAMLNVKAADCTIRNCEFEHANATNQAVDVILAPTASAAARLWVDNCDFHGTNNGTTNHAISLNGGTDIEINNCNFQGAYHASQGVIRTFTTAAVNIVVQYCTIQNLTASNTTSILLSTSTGQVRFNTMQILMGTAPISAASASWVSNNYYANAVATAGTLI